MEQGILSGYPLDYDTFSPGSIILLFAIHLAESEFGVWSVEGFNFLAYML